MVKRGKEIFFSRCFSEYETSVIVRKAFAVLGDDCEITIDTADRHYWNYKNDPQLLSSDWGKTEFTDYSDFCGRTLKICIQTDDKNKAVQIAGAIENCDHVKFSDGDWHMFTKSGADKQIALRIAAERLKISLSDVAAFGDDYADMGMIRLCGIGVAVGKRFNRSVPSPEPKVYV